MLYLEEEYDLKYVYIKNYFTKYVNCEVKCYNSS